MGYFKPAEIKRVELSNGYWADIKTNLTYGDVKEFVSFTGGKVKQSAALDSFLLSVITSWNLDDSDGNIVPVDEAHVDQLQQADAVAIIEAAGQIVAGDPEEKADFLDKSEASSTPEQ